MEPGNTKAAIISDIFSFSVLTASFFFASLFFFFWRTRHARPDVFCPSDEDGKSRLEENLFTSRGGVPDDIRHSLAIVGTSAIIARRIALASEMSV